MSYQQIAYRLTFLAAVLALVVVVLGAYTRLGDAGLGCPDWPGCYGQLTVPSTSQQLEAVGKTFPGAVVEPAKAWKEMIHRYVAGTLGLFILSLLVISLKNLRKAKSLEFLPLFLIGLVIFQALLGMWTVTLKLLPVVVMGHLLGGLTILSCLWLWHLKLRTPERPNNQPPFERYRPWVFIGIIIVFLQLILGGWTSSNYAALACLDFPTCQNSLWPAMDFKSAFNFFTPVGANFEGGLLNGTARVTIQMMHRLGALITLLYVGGLMLWLYKRPDTKPIHHTIYIVTALLILQVTLGILNVVMLLPLPIAVAHNGVAALLLLSLVTLHFQCRPTRSELKAHA